MLPPFALEEPMSVDDTSALLAQYGETARLYAGGTELLLAMKEGLLRYERLINIKLIPELAGIMLADGALHIGAITTHRTLERSAVVRRISPPWPRWQRTWLMCACAKWGRSAVTSALPSHTPILELCCWSMTPASRSDGGVARARWRSSSSLWGRSRWR